MSYRTRVIQFILVLSIFTTLSCGGGGPVDNNEVAVIETNYGRIVMEFLPEVAPNHVENFKELARSGFYDGTKIHRLVKEKGKPIAIQGGDPNTINGDPSTWGVGQPSQKTVKAEFSTMKHERGIVSAARKPDPEFDSATSQFFICTAPASQWDGKYSIFGRIIDGMSVVDTIARAPLYASTDRPLDPVVVSRVYLAGKDEALAGKKSPASGNP